MSKISITIKDGSDNALNSLRFNANEASVTLRVYASAATAETWINATRADFQESGPTGEDETTERGNAQELIDENMIEVKIGAGAWTPICGWDNAVDIGAISAGSYAELLLRINLASDAASIGRVSFGLAFRVIPA